MALLLLLIYAATCVAIFKILRVPADPAANEVMAELRDVRNPRCDPTERETD